MDVSEKEENKPQTHKSELITKEGVVEITIESPKVWF